MSSVKRTLALVLPPREHFRAADAGAVALTVRDFVSASAYRAELVVFGGYEEHFPDMPYHCAQADYAWLWGRNHAYGRACIAELKNSSIQLIEVHNRIALALQIKKALPSRQVAVHLHNDPHGMSGAKTAAQRRHLLETVDAVYCVSAFVRERLLDGVDAALATKAHVVYNALVANTLELPTTKQHWLVYAGRFIPEKGVLELAQALAEVLPKHPHWRAVFLGARGFGHAAGKSAYEQQVYAALQTVAEQVEFRGHVPQPEVMAVLAQSAITVVPSTCTEAFGRSALEAMSMRNAVLVSGFGALPEIAGDAAIVLPEVSADALAQQLERLLADTALCEATAATCQARAQSTFALATQAAHLDTIRRQLLETH